MSATDPRSYYVWVAALASPDPGLRRRAEDGDLADRAILLHQALFDPERRDATIAAVLAAAESEREVRDFTREAIIPLAPGDGGALIDRLVASRLDAWVVAAVRAEFRAYGEPSGDPQIAVTVERLTRGYWRSRHILESLAPQARPPRAARERVDAGWDAGWDAVTRFLDSRSGDAGSLFAALVAAAPADDRALPLLGTDLFETLHHNVGSRAMCILREAGLQPVEVKAILSGVWVTILRKIVDDGERIPLPDEDVTWLLDSDGADRDKYL